MEYFTYEKTIVTTTTTKEVHWERVMVTLIVSIMVVWIMKIWISYQVGRKGRLVAVVV
jgi:hypothetical protein